MQLCAPTLRCDRLWASDVSLPGRLLSSAGLFAHTLPVAGFSAGGRVSVEPCTRLMQACV